MIQRVFERVRRIELQLEIPPSHYEPGRPVRRAPATTGAHAAHAEEQRQSTQEQEAVRL